MPLPALSHHDTSRDDGPPFLRTQCVAPACAPSILDCALHERDIITALAFDRTME